MMRRIRWVKMHSARNRNTISRKWKTRTLPLLLVARSGENTSPFLATDLICIENVKK